MSTGATDGSGLVLFAYDGSELAGHAITEAGRELGAGRDALVLTVWEPFNVGFLPVGGTEFDAAGAAEVRAAAEKTALYGASLAETAGFRADSMTAEAAPTWKGIIDAADARDASLIVLGSHGRSGTMASLMVGSVASAVAARSQRSVLIVHHRHG